jgi:hypothetical protein
LAFLSNLYLFKLGDTSTNKERLWFKYSNFNTSGESLIFLRFAKSLKMEEIQDLSSGRETYQEQESLSLDQSWDLIPKVHEKLLPSPP